MSSVAEAHGVNKVVYKIIIIITTGLIAVSAMAEFLFPSKLLGFVGITSNPQMDFLLRTTAVALIAYLPSLWTARNMPRSPGSGSMLFGGAAYMVLSSVVDFLAFSEGIVNWMSVPSIAFRVFLGTILLWLMWQSTAK